MPIDKTTVDVLRLLRDEPATQEQSVVNLAQILSRPADQVVAALISLDARGLALFSTEEDAPPVLMQAGRQFLDGGWEDDDDALGFLPHHVDDLHARRALLVAGTIMVDEFRFALTHGDGVQHVSGIVPPAFIEAVSPRLAVDLFAAAVALMARLSCGAPAGCVAEEICAVELISQGEAQLEMGVELGRLSTADAHNAKEEFKGLFELFQDDDVLDLFDMKEPADAALAGQSFRAEQLGIADQRLSAWFRPFGGIPSTGHLDERDET